MQRALSLSQHKLATFLACQRRFQLRYVEEYPWPDEPQTEPLRRAGQRGEMFHRMLQRYFLGLEVDREGLGDEQLQAWWEAFLQEGPQLAAGERLVEVNLTVPVGGHLLTGRFDLLVLSDEGIHIYDWKTGVPQPEAALRQAWQTRLYLALAVEGSSALYAGGRALAAEQIRLTYWYAQAPADSVTFAYDAQAHTDNWAEIMALIGQIDAALAEGGTWPLTADLQICARCLYQVLCGRQEAVADLGEGAQGGDWPAAESEDSAPSPLEPEVP